jgi:hypothetical protein
MIPNSMSAEDDLQRSWRLPTRLSQYMRGFARLDPLPATRRPSGSSGRDREVSTDELSIDHGGGQPSGLAQSSMGKDEPASLLECEGDQLVRPQARKPSPGAIRSLL